MRSRAPVLLEVASHQMGDPRTLDRVLAVCELVTGEHLANVGGRGDEHPRGETRAAGSPQLRQSGAVEGEQVIGVGQAAGRGAVEVHARRPHPPGARGARQRGRQRGPPAGLQFYVLAASWNLRRRAPDARVRTVPALECVEDLAQMPAEAAAVQRGGAGHDRTALGERGGLLAVDVGAPALVEPGRRIRRAQLTRRGHSPRG